MLSNRNLRFSASFLLIQSGLQDATFEAAVAAASLAIREGHEVHVSVPDHSTGNQTALGATDQD
jgi:hypothetical protein